MTQSVPDSFSMDELSNLLENAPQEEDLHAENCSCNSCDNKQEYTPEFIEKIASDAIDAATDQCPDPLVHKVMAMMIMSRMVEWHKNVALRQLDNDNVQSMGAWMRDAGKFQGLMDVLCNIAIGPDDFTCSQE